MKICGKFLIFPSVIKRRVFELQKNYQHQIIKVKSTGLYENVKGDILFIKFYFNGLEISALINVTTYERIVSSS